MEPAACGPRGPGLLGDADGRAAPTTSPLRRRSGPSRPCTAGPSGWTTVLERARLDRARGTAGRGLLGGRAAAAEVRPGAGARPRPGHPRRADHRAWTSGARQAVLGDHARRRGDSGRTIVFATHYLAEADEFAERTVLMSPRPDRRTTARPRTSGRPTAGAPSPSGRPPTWSAPTGIDAAWLDAACEQAARAARRHRPRGRRPPAWRPPSSP